MQRIAFKMKLNYGCEVEYKKRHDALWPEIQTVLRKAGIESYSIFLDIETNILFAYLTIEDPKELDELPRLEVMKKWWDYMKDIMETNEDNSPASVSLKEVFYLE